MGITDIVTTDSWLTIYVQNEPFLQLLRDFFKDTKNPSFMRGFENQCDVIYLILQHGFTQSAPQGCLTNCFPHGATCPDCFAQELE